MTAAISLFEADVSDLLFEPLRAPGEKKIDWIHRVFSAQSRLSWVCRLRYIAPWREQFIVKHGIEVEMTFFTVICGGVCYSTEAQRQFVEMHKEQAEQYEHVVLYWHKYSGCITGVYSKGLWTLPTFDPPIGDEITMICPPRGPSFHYLDTRY